MWIREKDKTEKKKEEKKTSHSIARNNNILFTSRPLAVQILTIIISRRIRSAERLESSGEKKEPSAHVDVHTLRTETLTCNE